MNWPAPLDGDNPLHRWLNRLMMAAKAGEPKGSENITATRGVDGTALRAQIPITTTRPFFHPFRIYQVPHPTDSSKNRFSFQVRGGWVGMRGRYIGAEHGEHGSIVYTGTDGVVDLVTCHDFFSTRTKPGPLTTVETVDIPNATDGAASTPGNAVIWVLNPTLDAENTTNAGFWLEITDSDDVSHPVVQVKARMWSNSPGATGRPSARWPGSQAQSVSAFAHPYPLSAASSPSTKIIVPIGWVDPLNPVDLGTDRTGSLVPNQILNDHFINHFRPGVINSDCLGGHTAPMYFRGTWDSGDSEGLQDTMFYDGEIVAVPETIGGIDYINLFVHIGIDLENTKPTHGSVGTAWVQIAGRA